MVIEAWVGENEDWVVTVAWEGVIECGPYWSGEARQDGPGRKDVVCRRGVERFGPDCHDVVGRCEMACRKGVARYGKACPKGLAGPGVASHSGADGAVVVRAVPMVWPEYR